jgi:hypothetical protein
MADYIKFWRFFMKKVMCVFVSLFIVVVGFMGCDNGTTTNQEQPKFTPAQQGTWVYGVETYIIEETKVTRYANDTKYEEYVCSGPSIYYSDTDEYVATTMLCTWSSGGQGNVDYTHYLFFFKNENKLYISVYGPFVKQF